MFPFLLATSELLNGEFASSHSPRVEKGSHSLLSFKVCTAGTRGSSTGFERSRSLANPVQSFWASVF